MAKPSGDSTREYAAARACSSPLRLKSIDIARGARRYMHTEHAHDAATTQPASRVRSVTPSAIDRARSAIKAVAMEPPTTMGTNVAYVTASTNASVSAETPKARANNISFTAPDARTIM